MIAIFNLNKNEVMKIKHFKLPEFKIFETVEVHGVECIIVAIYRYSNSQIHYELEPKAEYEAKIRINKEN